MTSKQAYRAAYRHHRMHKCRHLIFVGDAGAIYPQEDPHESPDSAARVALFNRARPDNLFILGQSPWERLESEREFERRMTEEEYADDV